MEFLTSTPFLYESIIKMVIAAVLSLVIGVERELKRKPVGLKTSLVIATFSCLLTIISVQSVYEATPVPGINVTVDPLRLAAQIVSGIGFLGAGVILKRTDDSISGLTTAAMIWGAAGIGIAVGAGFYIPAIVAVLIILFGVEVIAPVFTRIGPERLRMQDVQVIIRLEESDDIERIIEYLKSQDFVMESITIKDIVDPQKDIIHEIDIRFSSLPENDTLSLYSELKKLHFVKDIEVSIL
ncbi:MgtC/SapB family protein [Kurthia sibirica]|uniref:Protein sapB n=1 Tax=Kurthia sibirica TaxID=202750 RepID=A0A2U3AHV9_9BACL|nr:MgtC/SapB family protein [Kurthia sibirica]PWI24142.1 protein sapB [Kurthia sibirica]GEK34665.1 methyltransferase [Kurthia sibirica]